MSYSTIPNTSTIQAKPYKIHVSDDELSDFKQLLKLARLAPLTFENNQSDPNKFGVTHEWMSSTKKHWETNYDWRKREDYLNSFPNFKAIVEDNETSSAFDIHFAALFSQKRDVLPIVFLHGWPGSHLEFLGIMDVFRKKYKAEELPYHIVAPSLPGWTLSSGPPVDRNFITEDIARVINNLMVGLFGDTGYIAQGGDIGSYVCRVIQTYPICKGIHLNFCMMNKPDSVPDSELDEVEKQGVQNATDFGLYAFAYGVQQGTRPATIGFALDASPISLLAWMGEKFLTWTDQTPPLDDILDSITLYWFTQSYSRCIYTYRQFHGSSAGNYSIHANEKYYCKKPLGYSYFPKEVAPIPKAWVATTGNLVFHKQHSVGGHFAAMELPTEMVEDLEIFLQKI